MERPRDPKTQQFSIKTVLYQVKDWSHLDPLWIQWLIGFVDGEGSFIIVKRYKNKRNQGWNCQTKFDIAQRADSQFILEEIRKTLDIGHCYYSPAISAKTGKRLHVNPMASFIVSKMSDCQALVSLFNQYPLRLKQDDFTLWQEAVLELAKGKKRNLDYFDYLYHAIRWIRGYGHSLIDLYSYNSDWKEHLTTETNLAAPVLYVQPQSVPANKRSWP